MALGLAPLALTNHSSAVTARLCTAGSSILIALFDGKSKAPDRRPGSACHAANLADRPKVFRRNGGERDRQKQG